MSLKKKRTILLAVCMALTFVSMTAWAEEDAGKLDGLSMESLDPLTEPAKTSVTLDPNGGTSGSRNMVDAVYGSPLPELTGEGELPTRPGYDFTGYFNVASGGTRYYNADGTGAKNWDKTVGTETLYAQWELHREQLMIFGTTVSSKTYDGNTVASVVMGTVEGIADGDVVTVSVDSATFVDRNAGTDIEVKVVYKITGKDSDKYIKPEDESHTADISAKPIDVTAANKSSFVGLDLVPLTYTADDLVGMDVFSGSLSTDANKMIAGNYEISQGTLTAGDNYEIFFTSGVYRVIEESYEAPVKPVKTGTWNDPVTDGIWKQGVDGKWTYSTNTVFKNTWGYLLNPYAADEKGKYAWFRFDSDGKMLTGWQFIDGKWYYLNTDSSRGCLGMCLLNTTTPDGYQVDANGAWIQ